MGAATADTATLPEGTEVSVVSASSTMAGSPLAETATPAGAAAVAAFMTGETAGGACVGTFLPAYGYGRVDAAATGAGHGEGGTANVCAFAAGDVRGKAGVETGPTAAGCNVVTLVVVGKLTCAPPAAVGGEADEAADVGWLAGGAAWAERWMERPETGAAAGLAAGAAEDEDAALRLECEVAVASLAEWIELASTSIKPCKLCACAGACGVPASLISVFGVPGAGVPGADIPGAGVPGAHAH